MSDLYSQARSYLLGMQDGIHGIHNESAYQYMVEMFNRIVSMFTISNFDGDISDKRLLMSIFSNGVIAAFNHAQDVDGKKIAEDVIYYTECSRYGQQDAYFRPLEVMVENIAVRCDRHVLYTPIQNKLLSGFMQTKYAALFYFDEMCTCIWPFIRRFAIQLAEIDSGIDVNLFNSKTAAIFEVDGEKKAETAKYIYDQISSGKPAVFARKNPSSEAITPYYNNVRNVFIADELSIEKTRIWNDFNTTIGYPNANTEKRERLVTDEVNSNNVQTKGLREVWRANLNHCAEIYNSLFGQNIRFDLNPDLFGEEKGGADHVGQSSTSGNDTGLNGV